MQSVAECDTDSSGIYYYYKVFGSGTRLIVTETGKSNVKGPQVSVFAASKPQSGKSVLMCQARGMFPDLVRFTWEARKQNGENMDLSNDEKLEQRVEDTEVQITSMLIVNEEKAIANKFTCLVQHDINIKDTKLEIPKEETPKADVGNNCPTKNPEEREEEESTTIGLFELSRSLYLFSVTYIVLLVKNVLYFCTISVLLFKRNPANKRMFSKAH